MYKYDRPEWVKHPISAQIDEALREVEQVKATLLALRGKAAQLNEYHDMKVAYLKEARRTRASDADWARATNAVRAMGKFGAMDAGQLLDRLDGWMRSLTESELGLHSLITDSCSLMAGRRIQFVEEEDSAWTSIRREAFLSGRYGPNRPRP